MKERPVESERWNTQLLRPSLAAQIKTITNTFMDAYLASYLQLDTPGGLSVLRLFGCLFRFFVCLIPNESYTRNLRAFYTSFGLVVHSITR